VAVAAATLPLLTTNTTTVADLPVATALAAKTTADVRLRASSMTGVKPDTDAPRRVAAQDPMSMVLLVRVTLKILTMSGPGLHPVATTSPTPTVMVAHTRQDARLRRVVPVPAAREVARHMTLLPSTHRGATRVCIPPARAIIAVLIPLDTRPDSGRIVQDPTYVRLLRKPKDAKH
jgi:hypothetical protein